MEDHNSDNNNNEQISYPSNEKKRKFHICINYELPDSVEFDNEEEICKPQIECFNDCMLPGCKVDLRYIPDQFCQCLGHTCPRKSNASNLRKKFKTKRPKCVQPKMICGSDLKSKIINAKFFVRMLKKPYPANSPCHRKECRCLQCVFKDLYHQFYRLENMKKHGKSLLETKCCQMSMQENHLCLTRKELQARKEKKLAAFNKLKNDYEMKMKAVENELKAESMLCQQSKNITSLGKCPSKHSRIPECFPNETKLQSDCKIYLALQASDPKQKIIPSSNNNGYTITDL